MERRTADLFTAGYGGVWTPPPGRGIYTTGGNGLGYDVYDRFDLGSAGDETLYGTEQGYRSAVQSIQRSGAKVYADYLINHASSFDWTDFDANGVRFADDPSNPFQANGGGNPGFGHAFAGDFEGDFHPNPPLSSPGSAEFEFQFQLALLWDIDHRKDNNNFIRQPVNAGDPSNIPNAGTDPFLLPEFDRETFTFDADPTPRLANIPTEKNRRFYPDQTDSDVVGDHVPGNPTSGLTSVTLQNFSGNEATTGVPVAENPTAYLMRHARWMVQDIGVDGFRVDAARHVYPFVHDFFDRGVWLADQRTNLDGSPRHVFSFLEAFTGDKAQLDIWHEEDITNPLDTSTVRSNRDVLDLPLFFAMHDNLTANSGDNNWHNIRNASFDVFDDNLVHDGSDGVMFVSSHDEEGAHLSNVAHAYMLLHPGEAIVYHNVRGFNSNALIDERPFPKDGRGDALGGLYGDTIVDLVNIRNTHGRGDFIERYIDEAFVDTDGDGQQFSNLYVYEREGSALVALNSRVGGFGDWDLADDVQTSFAPGEILVELTGNSRNPLIDSNEGNQFEIPEVLVVAADGTVDLRIPQNHPDGGAEHNSGYVIYGLATPDTTVSISNTSGTLGGEIPNTQTNDTALLTTIDVITEDSFEVRLDTAAVTHFDGGQSFRDRNADGDFAIIRLDDGREINGVNPNGTISGVDFDNPNDNVTYGFENFATESDAGFFNADGNGTFRQVIDATQLEEGEHYITTRAFRHRSDGGVPVYTEDRRVIYVDRLLPESAVLSFDRQNQFIQDESLTGLFEIADGDERDIIVQSLDLTAETVHIFANEGAAVSDFSLVARAQNGEGLAEQLDRDIFRLAQSGVSSGNHAFTVVTIEPTGTTNVQRFAGFSVTDGLGSGLADLNADGLINQFDLTAGPDSFAEILFSQNARFNPAADLDGDGLTGWTDLTGLESVLEAAGTQQSLIDAYLDNLFTRRGNVDELGGTDAADIDAIYAAFGTDDWFADIDSSGLVDQTDVDLMLSVILGTAQGDADLDGAIGQADLNAVLLNWGRTDAGWATGDNTGDGFVSQADLNVVLLNWGFSSGGASAAQRVIPEPATAALFALLGLGFTTRRRRTA
ncbi:MAG: PEP-CTERM sorting domain-containing protein [Planctomycetota bacterium]